MDTKFHLCLLLVILGSLTMQVHSQQGICEQSGGYCVPENFFVCPPGTYDCHYQCDSEFEKCCCPAHH
ncbi:small cysteine-rich protein 8-like isoform X1 [Oculina patagonica]